MMKREDMSIWDEIKVWIFASRKANDKEDIFYHIQGPSYWKGLRVGDNEFDWFMQNHPEEIKKFNRFARRLVNRKKRRNKRNRK